MRVLHALEELLASGYVVAPGTVDDLRHHVNLPRRVRIRLRRRGGRPFRVAATPRARLGPAPYHGTLGRRSPPPPGGAAGPVASAAWGRCGRRQTRASRARPQRLGTASGSLAPAAKEASSASGFPRLLLSGGSGVLCNPGGDRGGVGGVLESGGGGLSARGGRGLRPVARGAT